MRRWNIRLRLTLLFIAIQIAFVLAFGASVYGLFSHELLESVDGSLRDKADVLASEYEPSGDGVEIEMDERARANLWQDSIAQVLSPAGKVLLQNRRGDAAPLPLSPEAASQQQTEREFRTRTVPFQGHGEYRVGWQWDHRYPRPYLIAIGTSLAPMREEQQELLRIIGMAGMGWVLASAIIGWLVIGRLLRPLVVMSGKARQITAERLNERLDVPNPHDEIGQLAVTLNNMMGRLHASFDQIRRFTSDASHELRTPLTCMRSEVEVTLTQPRSPEEYREVLGSILEEIERLTRLSDALLTLARLDAGHVAVQKEAVDLNELLADAADRIRVQAETRGVTLQVDPCPDGCQVLADRQLLEQVLLNLLDNALKYGGEGIRLSAGMSNGAASIRVHDSGPGIPPEAQSLVFDRFYRVDKSRSRELGGAGLGLSLAKHYVELQGGQIRVESASGQGTTFVVSIPSAS